MKTGRVMMVVVLIGLIVGLSVSCDGVSDLLGFGDDEDGGGDGGTTIDDPAAVAGMEVVGGLIEQLLDGGGEPPDGQTFPDYETGTYPTGISVTQTTLSSVSVSLAVTITDVVPEAEEGEVAEDLVYAGSATIVFTDDADAGELTVEIDGTITVTGSDAPFVSMTIADGRALYPYTATSLGDPDVLGGTLTIDGEEFDMTQIDISGDDDDGDSEVTVDAAASHYFTVGYREDGGVNYPQILFSENCSDWTTDPIDLDGTGALRSISIDDAGLMVAVGENGLIYSSGDGVTWTRRGEGVVSGALYTIEWGNSTWIAAGAEVIARSTDGLSWSEVWTGSIDVHALLYAENETMWIAAGGPPQSIAYSTDNGVTWATGEADVTNRPAQPVCELFETSDDTEWIALAGANADELAGIYDGTDLEEDNDIDWVVNTANQDTSQYAALAGAVREGVYVAMAEPATGTDGIVMLVSSDAGDSWEAHSVTDIQGWPEDITAIGNGFLGVTNQGGLVRGSADGATWVVIDDDSYATYGVVYRLD